MFKKVSNPRWGNPQHTVVDFLVELESMPGVTLAFTAQKNDPEEHGRKLFYEAFVGKHGPIADYAGSLKDYKASRLAELAQKRWEVQTRGVVVFDHRISTHPSDVDRLNTLIQQAKLFDTPKIYYKTLSGFLLLDQAQLLEVARAVHRHTQQCYEKEAQHAVRMQALNQREQLSFYDFTQGW